jgi:hypothetical protein
LRFLFLAGVASALHGAVIFTFENESNVTPFTDTIGGLSATFESSGDPFAVGNGGSFFSFTFNDQFTLLGPAAIVTLTVSFMPDLSSVSMNFGTVSATAFNLSAFENGTLVGTASVTGARQGFTFPEGIITFNGGVFNSIQLTTSAQGFAIDNLSVDPAVPEANSLWLFLSGAAVMFVCMRRRRTI